MNGEREFSFDEMLDTEQAADLAGVKPVAIRLAISQGRLRSTKRRGARFIRPDDLQAYIAASRKLTPKDPARAAKSRARKLKAKK